MHITIVGGGTAGNLTALFCKKYFEHSTVQVIEDTNKGIIGVGESTTPALVEMLEFLDITKDDMIKHCGATIKNATRFTNWNGDNKFYHHGFNTIEELDLFQYSTKNYYTTSKINIKPHKPLMALHELYQCNSLEDLHVGSYLCNSNKIPFLKHNLTENYAAFGLHFDAKKVAEYFKILAQQRGVTYYDDSVEESRLNENGYVQNLKLKSGYVIETDFIFDCSGFTRLFVEKTYAAKFHSFEKYLPVKQAIPFFINNSGPTPTFTEAIALKYGWMWKTPVEDRYGCGYVFDSDYINKEEAYKEVSELLKFEPVVTRSISFNSGYFDKPWNKNVLSVGLSSGFLEPLEATSIWISVISLNLLMEHISGIIYKDERSIEEYNIEFNKNIQGILALVQFHYMTKRLDSDFWRDFSTKNTLSPILEKTLDIYQYRTPSTIESYDYFNFPMFSWLLVGSSLDYWHSDIILKEYMTYNIASKIKMDDVTRFKNNIKTYVNSSYNHDEYLKSVRQS